MQVADQGFTIGLVQRAASPDPAANLQATLAALEQAADQGAQVLCTQELFRSQYFCQTEDTALFDLAEPIPGPSTEALAALARSRQVVIVASIFERRAAGVHHNTAVVLDADGSLAGTYRKMHIPDDPLYHEKFYFTPGDTGFVAFTTRYGKIGVLLCWDQWFPECARAMALQDAEIFLYPTAIGDEPQPQSVDSRKQWQRVMQGHAAANLIPVVASNRIGTEESASKLTFYGSSFITDGSGEIVAEAPRDEQTVVTATFDLDALRTNRASWGLFRDRRTDLYGRLLTLDGQLE